MKTATSYAAIANRAKEFIDRHWQEHLTLEQIAAHVFMSPYHFQRIFKQETGETPKEYLTRLRNDGAVHLLRADLEKSVYDIAMDCGFSSQSVFTRAFHQRYGMSPTEFRRLPVSKITKLAVWDPGIMRLFLDELDTIFGPKVRKKFLASIRVERIEPIRVIYHPTTMKSEEHITDEFGSLANRAAAYDLSTVEGEYFGLMNDFPLHTPTEKCRYKVCMKIEPAATIPSKFFTMNIEGGKYAVFPVWGNFEKMMQLAVLFFNDWLRKSKYKMADLYWFERFAELPSPKGYSAAEREFYFPIKPA